MDLDVENNWLQDRYVDWLTGKSVENGERNDSFHTHCSSFVKAVCHKLNVPMLGPPEVRTEGLANKECKWLSENGELFGWKKIEYNDIIKCSNDGNLIVVCYYNSEELTCGHVAIIMPTHSCSDKIYVCHAGLTNHSCAEIKKIFGDLLNSCVYYVHEIDIHNEK